MINNYEIKEINNKQILFLYFDINCEFANINNKNKYQNIKNYIKDFIKENKITFNGAVAVVIVGSSIIGNVLLNKEEKIDTNTLLALNDAYQEIISNNFIENNTIDIFTEYPAKETPQNNTIQEISNQENIQHQESPINNISKRKENVLQNNTVTTNNNTENSISNNQTESIKEVINEETEKIDTNTYITIQRANGPITLELEEYITGVVSSEMPALFHSEALKAQSIIARTYALKAISKGQILSDTNSTQSYKDESQLKSIWGSNYDTYHNKIKNAVSSTKGMYLTYNGSYIEAVYHSTSNGKTEDSSNAWGNYFPYLVSVSSEYDNLNPSFIIKTNFPYEKLSNLLGMEINNNTTFNIVDRTTGDRVKKIIINDKEFTGINFRTILGLRSADFSIEKNDNEVIITTKGYGHGVGMSQYGANGMAKNGYSYIQILNHYYPGTTLNYQ